MMQHEIYDDGFRVRRTGKFHVRVNPDHVDRSVRAIRKRWDNETQQALTIN